MLISDSESAAWPVRDVLNSALVHNGTTVRVYNAPVIDVFVMNNPFTLIPNVDAAVQFNLSVQFQGERLAGCGAVFFLQNAEV